MKGCYYHMNGGRTSTLGLCNAFDKGAFVVQIPTLTPIIISILPALSEWTRKWQDGYPHFIGGEPETKG